MFSLQIVDTDAFLDMSISTQALYFHLVMRADDDGFVNNPKKIMKIIGSQEDDLKVLFAKRFIIGFESGIIVIKHWRMQNAIRNDRYIETVYSEEKKLLKIKENGAYTENDIPNGNQLATQVRLGKVRLDKIRLDNTASAKSRRSINFPKKDYSDIISLYEKLKGVKFSGSEYLPIQQTIKSMFIAGRKKEDIVALMETLNNSDLEHWQSWTIETVKKQLPLFISGRLKF
jgi:hypothetical protein